MKIINIYALASIFVTFTNGIETPVTSLIVEEALTAMNHLNFNDTNKILLENINVKTKREELNDENFLSCVEEQKKFIECYQDDGKSDDEMCKIINEERCVKFYEDPAFYLPSCEKYDKSLPERSFSTYKLLVSKYKLLGSLRYLFCDSNCAISQQLINKSSHGENEPSDLASPGERALHSDCRRKNCVEKAIDVYEKQREALEINLEFNEEVGYAINEDDKTEINNALDLINYNLEYLQTCAQQSGAFKINASNVLLLNIIIVIITFLNK